MYYFYDAENRLTKIEDSASAAVATYKYDAFGRRIEKVDSKASKTRRYYYDNRLRVLEEYDNAPAPARQAYFVWGNYVDELLLVNDDADDDADYYACRDHLYNVHVLYNPTNGITERYDYDAYGQPTIYTADGGDSDWWDGDETTANDSTIENATFFTGRRLDVLDSGDFTVMYYRARYYSPNTGRFISRDPIGYKDGMNLYQYVVSSPILYPDPVGLSKCTKESIRRVITMPESLKKLGRRFGFYDVTARFGTERSVCTDCCETGPFEGLSVESYRVSVYFSLMGTLGSPAKSFGPIDVRIGWYGRLTGSGSVEAGYNGCTGQSWGGGCVSVSAEVGLIASAAVKNGKDLFLEVGARGGVKGTVKVCLKCTGPGPGACDATAQLCAAINARVWAKLDLSWFGTWEYFKQWEGKACTDKIYLN